MYVWIIATILFISIDQLTKLLAVKMSWPIFFNNQFAFSLPIPVVLMFVIYILVLGGAGWYVFNTWKRFSNMQRLAWCLVFAGGLSNVLERIILGHVRDFIPIANGMLNAADFFILIGLVLLLMSARSHTPPDTINPTTNSSEKV